MADISVQFTKIVIFKPVWDYFRLLGLCVIGRKVMFIIISLLLVLLADDGQPLMRSSKESKRDGWTFVFCRLESH